MLTKSQLDQFHQHGYLLGGRVLADEQVDQLCTELSRVIEQREQADQPQPVRIFNMGGEATPVWQIVNIWEASAGFRELISNAKVCEEVAQLTGASTLRIWHDQIQYKPSGTGGVNMWHQDAPYWPILAPMTEVTAWVALDDVDADNGCMSMVPGSHRWGNTIEFLHTLKKFDEMPVEYKGQAIEVKRCPVKRGHVHFHHALTWHGSHANTSPRPRRAVALHYMTQETRFVASGQHIMKPLVEVADGQVMAGKHFPVVWQKSN